MDKDKGCFHEASFMDKDGQLRTSKVPVVQELARQGLNYLPERFIRVHPADHPTVSPPSVGEDSVTLPSINVAKLRGGSSQELARLASGAKEWGMFFIMDHGIPSCVLHAVKDVVKGFFGLSCEEEKASVGSYVSVDNMGYGRNFVKSLDQPLDWIDRLTMKSAPKGLGDGLLVRPQRPPNFKG